jgi:hypothetical protein
LIDGPYYLIYHIIRADGTLTFLDEDTRNTWAQGMPEDDYVAAQSYVDERTYRELHDWRAKGMLDADEPQTTKET